MKKIIITLLLSLTIFSANAKVLDKIIAVVDDKIITKSVIDRIQQNIQIRRNIAPFIYTKKNPSTHDLVEIKISTKMIRDKIAEFGYLISDQQVESTINERITVLGTNKKGLKQFLAQGNMSYDEYFELTREAIEHSVFSDKIISPMINITEQQVKNTYYKRNIKKKTMTFTYDLVDFYLPEKKVNNKMKKEFQSVLTKFQNTGSLPKAYSDIETNDLGKVEESGLTDILKNLLKRTDEGSFSKPILLGSDYHVFFIRKKDLKEASDFIKAQRKIKFDLYQEASEKMSKEWLERQKSKHYIKLFIK